MTDMIRIDAGKYVNTITIVTTFRLYRHNMEYFKLLAKLSQRIYKETGFESHLTMRNDKMLHLTASTNIGREAKKQKMDTVVNILKEIYNKPRADAQVQLGLW